MGLRDLFKKAEQGETVPVAKIVSSRAVYQTMDIQRVEMVIDLETGEKIILDMNLDQVAKTIQELTNCYEACRPPLRPRLGGTWT